MSGPGIDTAGPGGLPPELFASTLRLLEELTALSSASGDAAGLRRVAARLGAELTARGLSVEVRDGLEGGAGAPGGAGLPVLVARGARPGGRPLLLIGHLDTVLPAALPRREETRLVATGAVDMKGGLATLVGALDLLAHRGAAPPADLMLVAVPDEEVAGEISRAAVARWGATARALWVLEPGEPGRAAGAETVVGGRRGLFGWQLTARGRAAHSGLHFAAGRSALLAAARWCVAASGAIDGNGRSATDAGNSRNGTGAGFPGDAGDGGDAGNARGAGNARDTGNATAGGSSRPDGTGGKGGGTSLPTVNVGRLVAGDESFVTGLAAAHGWLGTDRQLNVVPDRAVAEGEVRFVRTADGEAVARRLAELAAAVGAATGTELSFTRGAIIPPVDPRGPQRAWCERAVELAAARGWRLEIEDERGGISFPNFLPDPGRLPVLDGLGPVGGGMHTREEHVDLLSLRRRIVLLADLLALDARGASGANGEGDTERADGAG